MLLSLFSPEGDALALATPDGRLRTYDAGEAASQAFYRLLEPPRRRSNPAAVPFRHLQAPAGCAPRSATLRTQHPARQELMDTLWSSTPAWSGRPARRVPVRPACLLCLLVLLHQELLLMIFDFSVLQEKKKKGSILVVGTAAGDVKAYDAQLGELKWRCKDCVEG